MDKKIKDRAGKMKDEYENGEGKYPKRKPRGGVLHGGDPTLARRVEEELHDFGVESLRSRS